MEESEEGKRDEICFVELYHRVMTWLEASTKAAIWDVKFTQQMMAGSDDEDEDGEPTKVDQEKDWPTGYE